MDIQIVGAKQHNLKDINVTIPRNKLVVITGVSGSGKSSLAFDTIFAEGQRQYLESLSTFARRYMQKVSRPNVDAIWGLSPTILLDQKPLGKNPRSTVGTATEIYTFLRLLFSRAGTPILSASHFSFNTPAGACENCQGIGVELDVDLNALIDKGLSLTEGAIQHRTWKVGSRYWNIINAVGLFDMNKPLKEFSDKEMDTLLYAEPIVYQNEEPGFVQKFTYEGIVSRLRKRQSDSRGLNIRDYDQEFLAAQTCHVCSGSRLNKMARTVTVDGKSIVELSTMPIVDLVTFLKTLRGAVAEAIVPSLLRSLQSLIDLKLDYLNLNRSVDTLSGGESQRVKLARQLVSSLTEMIYVLDEPTSGLHPKDIDQLVEHLLSLKEKPNTLVVVEHDLQFIRHSDYIIDLGPGAGTRGGQIVAEGSVEAIASNEASLTGKYLNVSVLSRTFRHRRQPKGYVELRRANLNNLRNLNVVIPLRVLVCLTGVSGAGKSSLVNVLTQRHRDIVIVDQSPVGSSSRSNSATYVGVFDQIRNEFARLTKQAPSLFSFNSEGACPACNGLGYETLDMHFLDDVRLTCEECKGRRFNDTALLYRYKGKTIADALEMTIDEAVAFFDDEEIRAGLAILADVGLGYLQLGQSLDTLSGGEAQRVKLAKELRKKGSFYVLDEPTTGLHSADIDRLLNVLHLLVDRGNTVLVVEHNLDVIASADWIIDLGPGGGKYGGEIVAEGPPEAILEAPHSQTGVYLRSVLRP